MRVTIAVDGVELFNSGERDPSAGAVKALATVWAGLDDDAQARFFQEVADILAGVPRGYAQAGSIWRHMATCTCIGPEGRSFLAEIVQTMQAEPR